MKNQESTFYNWTLSYEEVDLIYDAVMSTFCIVENGNFNFIDDDDVFTKALVYSIVMKCRRKNEEFSKN